MASVTEVTALTDAALTWTTPPSIPSPRSFARHRTAYSTAAALRFGFEELDSNRVTAYHMVRNAASRRVLTRRGFSGRAEYLL
jgi:hypothetical protein